MNAENQIQGEGILEQTTKTLETHLITRDPCRWVAPFVSAGSDTIVFCINGRDAPSRVVEAVKGGGTSLGISLAVDDPVEMLDPYWYDLDIVSIVCTDYGVRGLSDIAKGICDKINDVAAQRDRRGLAFEIESDGAIRRHTVGPLRRAGTDIVVAGSVIFKENLPNICKWLHSL